MMDVQHRVRGMARAVLIGVDDYSAYDASVGNAPGTSDNRGARNDVRTYVHLCRALGIAPEEIRVLTSPPLDAAELGIGEVREATRAEILEAGEWLAQGIEATGGKGILSFSGHGDAGPDGLLLCPTDVSGAELDQAIPLSRLGSRLSSLCDESNITFFLDACHAGGDAQGGTHTRTLRGRPMDHTPTRYSDDGGPLVVAACRADQTSAEAAFDGVWQGALSWAVRTVLDRWTVRMHHGDTFIDISYADLVHRVGALLDALTFTQVPEHDGPASLQPLPLFHRRSEEGIGRASAVQTASIFDRELPPDLSGFRAFEIVEDDDNRTQIGLMVETLSHFSPAIDQKDWQPDMQNWWITNGNTTPPAAFRLYRLWPEADPDPPATAFKIPRPKPDASATALTAPAPYYDVSKVENATTRAVGEMRFSPFTSRWLETTSPFAFDTQTDYLRFQRIT